MENEIRTVTEKWMEFAQTDLGIAKHLNDTYYPKPLEVICYHCQQSAEKAIKSLLIIYNQNDSLPKTHNLSFLLQQVEKHICVSEDYYDIADLLTPYGIAARYPNEIFIDERHVCEALNCSEKILCWVNEKICEYFSESE